MMNPGVHAALIAAEEERRKKLQNQEEERMTRYNSQELEGDWEFKIVRSNAPVFRKPDVLQQVLMEEAQAGWQMLEKLDDNRIRLKRPATAQRRDSMLPSGVDPYRTQIRGSGSMQTMIMLGVILLLFFGGLMFFFFQSGGGFNFGGESYILISIVVLMALVAGVAAVIKARS
jgi:hypothetical protein